MRTDELHDLLERAAAPVERPDLARTALDGAHRVRVRRRALVVGATATATVTVVVVAGALGRPSAGPGPVERPDDVVQDFWDVRAVGELPARGSTLPEEVEQPASAPALADEPLPAAVLGLWGEGDVTYLLSPEGEWRSVPHPGPEPWLAELSDDGSRLAMPARRGLEVWDLATGSRTVLPWPAESQLPVTDLVVTLRWAPDGDHVLVVGATGSWLLGLDGTIGYSDLPVQRFDPEVHVDDRGRIFELPDVDPPETLQRAEVRDGLVAAVRGDGAWSQPRSATDHDGLVVHDLDDGTVRAYLPIRDTNAAYTDNGGLAVHGWLDDETVLAWVLPERSEDWSLVAWHYPSGELTRLAGGDSYARLTDVVPSLLER